jgi:hypothetical protein
MPNDKWAPPRDGALKPHCAGWVYKSGSGKVAGR